MEHLTQQHSNNDPNESQTHNMSQTTAAEQLLALSLTTNRAPTTMRHPPPSQHTAPPSETSTFLASLSSHYAARSDVITPHIFTQLCKDYHTRNLTETDFYVSVYRLFCATDAQNLMQGFRAFLPRAWRRIELGWLERAVEEDVKRQAQESREVTRMLVEMLEGVGCAGGGVERVVDDDDAMLVDDDDDDDDDDAATTARQSSEHHAEVLLKTPESKKKRTPKNAFRSATKTPSRLAESRATSPGSSTSPTPEGRSEVASAAAKKKPVVKKKGRTRKVAFCSTPEIPSLLVESRATSPDSTSPTPEDHSEVASAAKKKPLIKKGKNLLSAFRSSPRVPSPLVESSTTPQDSVSPTPEDHSEASATKKKPAINKGKNLSSAFLSSPKAPSPLVESSTTSPESTPAPTKTVAELVAVQEEEGTPTQTTSPPRPTTVPSTLEPASLDRTSTPKASPSPLPRSSSPSTTPVPSGSKPTKPTKPTRPSTRPSTPLPPASTIPHLGPIYRDKRAILTRPNKPYIHALCGQRFGNPAEVLRHHNGQSGRPGCWAKKGKPGKEAGGDWDEHVSCKVRVEDLEYVRVKEGFVVTSWGGVEGVEGLRVGEEEGVDGAEGGASEAGQDFAGGVVDAAAGGDAVVAVADVAAAVPDDIDIEDSKKRKRPVLRLKLRSPTKPTATATKPNATGVNNDEDEGNKSDEDLKAFVSAQSSPEPAKKRQKKTLDTTAATEVDNASASLGINAAAAEKRQKSLDNTTGGDDDVKANAAAAHAVVFGLRARK